MWYIILLYEDSSIIHNINKYTCGSLYTFSYCIIYTTCMCTHAYPVIIDIIIIRAHNLIIFIIIFFFCTFLHGKNYFDAKMLKFVRHQQVSNSSLNNDVFSSFWKMSFYDSNAMHQLSYPHTHHEKIDLTEQSHESVCLS